MNNARSARHAEVGDRRDGVLDFKMLAGLCVGKRGDRIDVACPICGPDRPTLARQNRRVLRIWWSPGFAGYCCVRCGIEGWARDGSVAVDPVVERQRVEQREKQRKASERGRDLALKLFREALPIASTPAERYLNSRGISEFPPLVHKVLRFHPHCPFGKDERREYQYLPCLVALLRDVVTNAPTGIQRTVLSAGRNIEADKRRMCLGRKIGAAIKLWPDGMVLQGLVIGEGLETVMWAATHIVDDGALLQPAWAVVDAQNLETFPILPGIETLNILVDHDLPSKPHPLGRGQEAAQRCATRWRAAGREAIKFTPRVPGEDFNDLRRLDV